MTAFDPTPYEFGRPGALNRAFDRYQAAMNLAFLRTYASFRTAPQVVRWGPRGPLFRRRTA